MMPMSDSPPPQESNISIRELKSQAGQPAISARVWVQVDAVQEKESRNGKPFLEIRVVDAEDGFTLRAWSDSPIFSAAGTLQPSFVAELDGDWTQNEWGIDAQQLVVRGLTADEVALFFAGSAELLAKQTADLAFVKETVSSIRDPRLLGLCDAFFEQFGERFQRTAAARRNHHARRGGLVEHVAQMMRAAIALQAVYPWLNRDLLIAGVLFHDCGKLWENHCSDSSFVMPFSTIGELLGHIPIGMELVNKLWRDIKDAPEAEDWEQLEPASETVRLHLLHLVAAHHGELQFGSPVLPKTPEAYALHYVDNLDAKLEMVKDAYQTGQSLAEGITGRVRPLQSNLVAALSPFQEAAGSPPEAGNSAAD
ncbi:MAG: 3'-5' exoribonuclease [Verrucomicrobiales bacterium]|jgi:3'-5' exoribonuclease